MVVHPVGNRAGITLIVHDAVIVVAHCCVGDSLGLHACVFHTTQDIVVALQAAQNLWALFAAQGLRDLVFMPLDAQDVLDVLLVARDILVALCLRRQFPAVRYGLRYIFVLLEGGHLHGGQDRLFRSRVSNMVDS